MHLEEADKVILDLIKKSELAREISKESRQWMLKHWAPEKMAGDFLRHYNDVLKAPRKTFAPRFSLETRPSHYSNIGLYDSIWKARQSYWPNETPKQLTKIETKLGGLADSA